MAATLYLIPAPLGYVTKSWLPEAERQKILHIRHFVTENPKTTRAHLKALNWSCPINTLAFLTLNNHSTKSDLMALSSLFDGNNDIGLLSEAGCPAIADPGAELVALAHDKGYRVSPLIGPSSLLLALMASGACGQRFTFHGYLPKNPIERIKKLKAIELCSAKKDESQIFIETPYRNNALFMACLKTLRSTTRLTVAYDLTQPTENIISQTVGQWSQQPSLDKKPCVFVLYTQ